MCQGELWRQFEWSQKFLIMNLWHNIRIYISCVLDRANDTLLLEYCNFLDLNFAISLYKGNPCLSHEDIVYTHVQSWKNFFLKWKGLYTTVFFTIINEIESKLYLFEYNGIQFIMFIFFTEKNKKWWNKQHVIYFKYQAMQNAIFIYIYLSEIE